MNIIYIILSIVALSFLIAYIRVNRKLGAVSAGFAELYLSYTALIQSRSIPETQNDTVDLMHKENFIKFLSDSRDWAFSYIEDVQKGLEKFILEVEPHIKYYDEYGIAIEGMVPPHDNALKTISKEFKELKNLLPQDTDDQR